MKRTKNFVSGECLAWYRERGPVSEYTWWLCCYEPAWFDGMAPTPDELPGGFFGELHDSDEWQEPVP